MHDKVDVLIIGSGASGAAVAWSLADTKMRILCLEQGDWVKPTDYPTNGATGKPACSATSPSTESPGARDRLSDQRCQLAGEGRELQRRRRAAPSCTQRTIRAWHPSDFRVKTLDGVAEDWPVDYQTLEPYFAENDRMMGVAGLAGDPAYPLHHPPMPPLPLGKSGQRFGKALNSLGWHWWPSDSAIATVEYDGRAPCINLGHCTPGCAQGAKASTDITYWPAAIRAGVELRTRARVREITTDETGMATGAIYYDAEGQEHFQSAEMVIVACNGVGTPRLLLNSVSAKFPTASPIRAGWWART